LRYADWIIFLLIACIYALALPISPMDIDASQYASISKEMAESGNFLQIWDRTLPYLDKPPLLFWLSAASYKLLSISALSYKLPSVLFWCLGVWATYRLARLYYDAQTARLAALILASTQAAFLITNDVRTDTLLTANVVLAIYFLAAATHDAPNKLPRWLLYFLGFSAVAFAMMSKGPIGALVPAMALGGHWLVRKAWADIFKWQWILGVLVILLWLSPMSYGLYTQFDLHPTQVVNGKTAVSGLRFFYWTQSFGRITGESTWENETDALFLVHTSLWAFLPWAFLMFWAFGKRSVDLFFYFKNEYFTKKTNEKPQEWISFFGFLLPLIALSLSRYKLPHYIFVAYPMAAIFTAAYIQHLAQANPNLNAKTTWAWVQYLISNILAIGAVLISCLVFYNIYFIFISIFIVLKINILYYNKNIMQYFKTKLNLPYFDFVIISLVAILGLNIVLSGLFYPNLLRYQSPTAAGEFAKTHFLAPLYDGTETGNASIFVAAPKVEKNLVLGEMAAFLAEARSKKLTKVYIFGYDALLEKLKTQPNTEVTILQHFDDFAVTHLKLEFLNPATRKTVVGKSYLVEVRL
jgi:4-amino-4-deoxy-L-arabinose transferase-like glycosyltransferase